MTEQPTPRPRPDPPAERALLAAEEFASACRVRQRAMLERRAYGQPGAFRAMSVAQAYQTLEAGWPAAVSLVERVPVSRGRWSGMIMIGVGVAVLVAMIAA